jgi:hypothetical protein
MLMRTFRVASSSGVLTLGSTVCAPSTQAMAWTRFWALVFGDVGAPATSGVTVILASAAPGGSPLNGA